MEKGSLYLCATPIGNLGDMSARALEILKSADLIACEDTRHSMKLMNHFGISNPLISYHEHNKNERGEYLVGEMISGKNVALITDAGTPAISDPGEDLVRRCHDAQIRVVPIPGPAALINALIISGQSTSRFSFEGFLSVNRKSREEHLKSVENDEHTLIFYEAPHKLVKTLCDMQKHLGNRSISIIKELTKIHENVMLTTIDEALKYFENTPPKGEYVLVVAGKSRSEALSEKRAEYDEIPLSRHVEMLMEEGMDKKDAIKEVAKLRGIPKRQVYSACLSGEQ